MRREEPRQPLQQKQKDNLLVGLKDNLLVGLLVTQVAQEYIGTCAGLELAQLGPEGSVISCQVFDGPQAILQHIFAGFCD